MQLPGYLEKLEFGARDLPLFLLPTLNELRAVRDAPLLSEVTLFAPELERNLASGVISGKPNPSLSGLARKLRHPYHKALLDLYRDRDAAGGLRSISEIFGQLETESGTEQVKRLFTVGKTVAIAMEEGVVDIGVATKLLLGRVDKEIKRIIDHGELTVAETPANGMLKNLLYYVACAENGDNPLIAEVKADFDLGNSFVSQSDLERERGQFESPGQGLLDSLRSAISTDLTVIKDGLDLFIRNESNDQDRLFALGQPMHKLADTLGMVGQGGLRQRLKRQADRIDEIKSTSDTPSEQDLMAMAEDILFTETSLENLSASGSHQPVRSNEELFTELPAGEYDRLINSVMHEAGIDMARNKDAIIEYIESPQERGLTDEVPARFSNVAGAFRILNLSDAAALMDSLAAYVSQKMMGNQVEPTREELESFADVVTSVEYFMQAVTEGRGIHPEILEVAHEAMDKLSLASPAVDGASESAGGESTTTDDGVVSEEHTSAEADLEQEVLSNSAIKPPLEDIDPEILDIFLEESKEELAVIQEYLPRWKSDHSDVDALTVFRRSFHTLKGSGRLVGASTIGEFAWSVENLLNRIIDETVDVSPAVLDILGETLEILPLLIEARESGLPPSIDVQPAMDRAFALANPRAAHIEPTAVEAKEREDAAADQTAADEGEVLLFPGAHHNDIAEVDESVPAISMDDTLLGIFREESITHLETMGGFLEGCRQTAYDCRNDRELMRLCIPYTAVPTWLGLNPLPG